MQITINVTLKIVKIEVCTIGKTTNGKNAAYTTQNVKLFHMVHLRTNQCGILHHEIGNCTKDKILADIIYALNVSVSFYS